MLRFVFVLRKSVLFATFLEVRLERMIRFHVLIMKIDQYSREDQLICVRLLRRSFSKET